MIRRLTEVFKKTVEYLVISHDTVAFVLQRPNLIEHSAKTIDIFDPMRVASYANKRLEIYLHFGVAAKMADQIGQLPVILLHDRRLHDHADARANPFLFGEHVVNTVER